MPVKRKTSITTPVLQLDICDSSNLITKYHDVAIEIFKQLRNFILMRVKNIYSGKELQWPGDGGIYIFDGDHTPGELCKKAVLSAIEIQHSLVVFNTFISNSPFNIRLRLSLDFQTLNNIDDPTKILEPRYSWFLKYERDITNKEDKYIAITEDVLPYIGDFRSFCFKSHTVRLETVSGNSREIQVYYLNTETALQNDSLFSLIHHIKKKDTTLFQFLNHNLNLIETTLDSLYKKHSWRELLSLREYLYQFFEKSGQYRIGINAGQKFIEAAENLNDRKAYSWILIKDLGWLYLLNGDYDMARECFEKSKMEFLKGNDTEGLFYYHRYLSVLHYMESNNEKSEEELKLAEIECRKCSIDKIKPLLARLMNNRGRLHHRKNELNKSLKYFHESLDVFESLNDQEHATIVKINLGELYLLLDNQSESEKYLVDGLLEASHNYWLEGCGRAKYFLAKLFNKKNELMASKIFILEAQNIFIEINSNVWLKRTQQYILENK